MSKIKAKETIPELILKKEMNLLGFVYHPKSIFGNPDFINQDSRIVVFIDGCFWHKCPKHFIEPKSNKKYWIPKIEKNVVRDKEITLAYEQSGWTVKRIWEHELKK